MRARDKIICKRSFEKFLRRHGFSALEAKRIISASWPLLKIQPDSVGEIPGGV